MSEGFGSRLPLSRSAVDRDHLGRLAPLDEALAEPGTRVMVLAAGRALVRDGGLVLLAPADAPAGLALYLGRALADSDGLAAGAAVVAVLVADAEADAVLAAAQEAVAGGEIAAADGVAGVEWGDLRRLGHALSERDAGLFTEALALANWHLSHGHSPHTGAATEVRQSGWVRVDPATGHEVFPRTDPAVIVGVVDQDDRLLLGSNAQWEPTRFSLLAGFVEPGESLEAAVVREVFEESGVRVVDPVYLGSQPWPFPASLMLGFLATAAPGQDLVGRPDGEEIVEVRWFTRDQLADAARRGEVTLPGKTSIARAIVEHWYGGPLSEPERA